jgi:multiple sugar transport system substrate-binding protein
MRTPRPGRARILSALAVAAALLATACTSSKGAAKNPSTAAATTPGEKVSLQFWSWVPGVDTAVALWNKEHPDIHVTLQKIPAGGAGGYAKMHAALKAGNAPDLAQVEYQEIPGFLLDHGLVDLNKYGASQYESKFVPWQWQQGTFGDGVYAIPQASGPMGLFYRADLFAKYGITKPPATWAQYEQDAIKIHHANPKAYIGTFPPGNSAWFTALAWQAGARWFGTSGDAWTVNIDNAATEKVAAYWDKLRTEGVIATEPDFANGWYKHLQTGEIAAWVSAQWGDAILTGNAPKTAGKWKVAPLPQWTAGDNASANWGGSSTALLTGTKHPEQALQFAVWLNSDPQSIALLIKGGYGWPAASAGYAGSTLDQPSAFFGGQKYNDVFAASDQQVDTSWRWIPTIDQVYQHLNDGFSAAVNGKGSFLETVKQAQGEVIADLKSAGLQAEAGA